MITKTEKTTLILMFVLVTTIGLMGMPQDAYAGFNGEEEEPEVDHGSIVQVHCEVHYYWEMEFIDGFREGYGDCFYFYEDEFVEEQEVFIFGEFTIGFTEEVIPIEGTFHIEDEDGNAIWILEDGSLTLGECETEESQETFIPYCLDTTGTIFEGEGIFNGLTGEVERLANGYITHLDFPEFTEGFANSIIWIFFDQEEVPKKSSTTCTNCQQPSIGVTDRGIRVVDDGLTVNGDSLDAQFYNTPYPLIHSAIGKPIDFVFKIWDDRLDNIKHVQVQLGKNKVGESFNKVASAIWDRNIMTDEVTVTHDPMFTNVIMERLADQPCRVGTVDCTVIHVSLTPTEAIVGDVVFGLNIWDSNGNAVTSFFNDGIQIGTQDDIIVIDTSTPVVKKQQRFDDGLGHVDDRNSEAFQMKLDWHNTNIIKLAQEMGY